MDNSTDCMKMMEHVLEQQISLLAGLYTCQKRMYESVLTRDWIMLQKELALSSGIAERFANLEEERLAILKGFAPNTDSATGFYRITASFPDEGRARINAMYREVKRLLLLSRTESDVFNTYIKNARTLLTGMFDTVLAGRHNKIYTRKGALASTGLDSVVLNRSF